MAVGAVAIVARVHAAPATQPDRNLVWEEQTFVAPGGKSSIVTHDGQRVLCVGGTRDGDRHALQVFESGDFGQSFVPLGTAVDSDVARGCDLGDPSILQSRDGTLWVAYRHNHLRGEDSARPRYSIHVARSRDNGATWENTLVADSTGTRGQPSRGLWASFLFERSDGVVQCYYDDEDSPFPAGKAGHQWITMKTWDPATSAWIHPVTASRAHAPGDLSRDGMMSVVEIAPNRLLMVFESVQTKRPHANVVRSVTSEDGGATWSWTARERDVVYSPPRTDGAFMALAPWMARCNDGRLVVVFCTDEDRDRPFVSGTLPHQMRLDVKAVVSVDDGKTWGPSSPVFDASHHYYLAGVTTRTTGDRIELLATCFDFSDGNFKCRRGYISEGTDTIPRTGR